jgi:hypothetical protein
MSRLKNLLPAILIGLSATQAVEATVQKAKRDQITFNTNGSSRKRKTNKRKAGATAKRRARRKRND